MPRSDPNLVTSSASWELSRAKVVDDRSRLVPLVAARQTRAQGVDAETAGEARKAAWRGMPRRAWAHFALMAGLESLIVMLAARGLWRAYTSPFAKPNDWIHPAMMIGFAVVIVWLVWRGMRRQHAGSLATEYVRAGVCGSCGYALQGLGREPDGCVVCPECGAAWKVPIAGA